MFRRLFLLTVILFPLVAIASESVTGKITINGQPKALKYVYAWKEASPLTQGKINTVVLLSDAKLDEKTRADRFALIDAARKGKFTGVQLAITNTDNVATGTIYTAAEDGYFDAAGMHKWEKKTRTDSAIAGKVSTDNESHFFKTSFSYSATFEAPIGPAPKK